MSASPVVVGNSGGKLARAVKGLWDQRADQNRTAAPSPERILESQVDDVLLVLALLGEALLPLGVLNDAHYPATLAEVNAAIASCGHQTVAKVFEKLEDEVKYLCTAGFVISAVFAPMHVYRGFGACVFSDWDWACPDINYLERKVKKETTIFQKKPDPQPNRPILLAFDRAIQVLQVKSMGFLAKRPSISGFAEQQPRYTPRSKKEIKEELSLCEDWFGELEKRGHPSPSGRATSSWGMPWAGWTSQFSFRLVKDWELVLLNQMDPGRLLHAFLCRGALNLHDGQLLTLPPGTLAESIVCWLHGLPGMTYKIIDWSCFENTARFEKKAGKKLCGRIGRYPLPSKYVIRDPTISQAAVTSHIVSRAFPPRHTSQSSPPPYYSAQGAENTKVISGHDSKKPSHHDIPVAQRAEPSAAAAPATTETTAVPPPKRSPPPPPGVNRKPATIIKRKPAKSSTLSEVRPRSVALLERSFTAPPIPIYGPAQSDMAPPRPPKIPLDGDSGRSRSQSDIQCTASTDDAGRAGESRRYLELLNAVAKGYLSPQELQEILYPPTTTQPQARYLTKQPYITAEPQELDSDPAPPKFLTSIADIPIPRGEIRRAYASVAFADPWPSVLLPGKGPR
jgi:hypothetical protein